MFLSNANKTKTYYIYFDNPVTNKRTSRSCKTKLKREAQKVLQSFKIDSTPKSKIDKSSLKLSDIRDTILTHYKSNNAKNTFLSYQNTFDNLIRLIGDKFINSINKTDVEGFKTRRSKEVSLVSTNIDIRNLKALYNKMIEFELVDQSKLSSVKQFKIEKKKMLAIDLVDIKRILKSQMDLQLNQIIRFTLFTASRISEVLNVKVKDLDFGSQIINIFQQKTNSYKTIPLTESLLELIYEIMDEKNDNNILKLVDRESLLFYNKIKNIRSLKLRADTVSKQFKKILKKLNLSSDFKFHSLRHSAITELLKNNVPLNSVKEIAGHKSISTTMLYSHFSSEDLKKGLRWLKY